jgi:thiamine-monophosphate kinase
MGEFELISRYFDRGPARRSPLGIGDDGALIEARPRGQIATTSDMLVEGRHFFAGVAPRDLGHKSLAVNLSDLAAMGAEPFGFLLSIAMPAADPGWVAEFAEGLFALADTFGCELLGGDTTAGPLVVSITAFGHVPAGAALRRDGAQPGDDLWVSGDLGGPSWGVAERYAGRGAALSARLVERIDRPVPRVALGIELRHIASAAIDLSDGLLGDLAHLLDRSRVGAEVHEAALPVAPELAIREPAMAIDRALAGGDDYELLFTAPAENRRAIAAIGERLGIPLARIGTIRDGASAVVVDRRGHPRRDLPHSHEHFA